MFYIFTSFRSIEERFFLFLVAGNGGTHAYRRLRWLWVRLWRRLAGVRCSM